MTGSPPAALRPQHPSPRSLHGLAETFDLEVHGDIDDLEVTGVVLASSAVRPGDLYVGVPGRNAHGAQYAGAAGDAGAVAVLTDAAGAELAADSGLPILVTPDARAALGEVAAWIHRTADNPATLFAVTGTNGKTSVVYLLYGILRQLGVVAGLTSTAERRIGDEAVTSSLTTPEASELHALLARMREVDVRAVGVEVSAQALSRHRVDGLVFDVVGFTNLTHDHLDDYASMDVYFEAKRELFQPERSRRGVVTIDSEWGRRLVAESRIPVTTLSTNPDVDADWRLTVLEEAATHTSFVLEGTGGRRLETLVPLLGWYMAANAALAIVMLVESGYDLEQIAHVLERDGGVDAYIPGRAERISGDRGPLVYIDYGHSPDAFLQTLGAIRRFTTGKLIMLFGADGDRDTTKRAEMGAIAARGADVVVVTDFHPRWEDPAAIRAALIAGARDAVPDREIHEIADPRAAFRAALELADDGDAILYAGPGHEDYHEVKGVKIPYSARDDAKQALREAGWGRMIALTLAEIASAVGGSLRLDGTDAAADTVIAGAVTTDSREVTAGDVFFAKRGEFDDGHRFAPAAADQGAALLVVEHALDLPVPQVVVADTVDALGALATEVVRRVRAHGRLRIVGVTGSNGKTTTKNLLREILQGHGDTVASRKSFNNEVGGPITALELTDETEFLVAEMGASAVGEIARLVRMAHPDVGIVLKVGLAHAGEFGGIEQTVRAKSEMVTELTAGEVAILNADDPRVVSMAGLTDARVVWFGLGEGADVRATDLIVHTRGTEFTITAPDGASARVRFGVLGEHHVMNALAATAAALELGVPLPAVVEALESVTLAERWRMQVMGGRDGITVINDAYNASPDSMAAALKTLAQVQEPGTRTIAVLGEMSELGEFSGEEHDRIGLLAVRLGISQLVVVGQGARRLHITAINEGSWDGESAYVETADEAFDLVVSSARPGDTVLVKSSNSAGLRHLGDRLGEWFA